MQKMSQQVLGHDGQAHSVGDTEGTLTTVFQVVWLIQFNECKAKEPKARVPVLSLLSRVEGLPFFRGKSPSSVF